MYSVIQVKQHTVLMQDDYGDLQVFTKDFFDYDVQENDIVFLSGGMFRFSQEETDRIKQQNFDRMQSLLNEE